MFFTEYLNHSHNHVEWNKIHSFRNIIAHDYFGIDEYEVWQIIKLHLPKFKNDLENINIV